jgi:hypothetical protein
MTLAAVVQFIGGDRPIHGDNPLSLTCKFWKFTLEADMMRPLATLACDGDQPTISLSSALINGDKRTNLRAVGQNEADWTWIEPEFYAFFVWTTILT